ncbi:MAG: zinc ribbon domain-containing protein [Thermodesulfobacteriota bacterium]|nr:zinc ribbon domain-containing protein [Thermodesulfobacteriota bacterium]
MDLNTEKPDLITVPYRMTISWRDCAGLFLNRAFLAIRDRAELWAVRCPSCERILFPPEIVCGMCKVRIEDREENWIKLGNEGEVVNFYKVVGSREVDPSTGWTPKGQTTNPIGFIRPEGGNEWTILVHILEETEPAKLHKGLRVEAVWKPKEERQGVLSDIKFWRTVEGQ